MVRDIRISADVEALLGSAAILRLHRVFASYDCCLCGMPGCTDENATAVVVTRYQSRISHIQLVHAWCADSQIVEADSESPKELSGEMDSIAVAAVLSFSSAPMMRPLLLIEPQADATTMTESGKQINLFCSYMLDAGLTRVRTAEELPGRAEGWELHLHGSEVAALRSADAIVYEGGFGQPEFWRKLVLSTCICVVLLGQIGLYPVQGDEMTFARLTSMIDSAARAGELVGGIVTVRETRT
jgi:hypothetical protein